MTAGGAASHEAERCRLRIEAYHGLLRQERQRLGNFAIASRSEKQVAARIAAMSAWGWHLLADRRWPGTRHANVDMIAVGPGGVMVVDVKAWAEPRVEDGVLFRGEADATEDVDRLLRVTELVEQVAAEVGLVPLHVHPVMVFAGRKDPDLALGRTRLIGEQRLASYATLLGSRLSEEQVSIVGGALAEAFPAYEEGVAQPAAVSVPQPVLPRQLVRTVDEPDVLFETDELLASILEAELAAPIEDWMTFLHPEQVRLVRRTWNGPARIRGPAGTGKTVVGLHRAAYLTASRPGRILYVSFVRTLPVVLATLYARMSPGTADRVEFTGLHRWASALLRDRHVPLRLDASRAGQLFDEAWLAVGAHRTLGQIGLPRGYWRDEIDHVIKGRGLTDFSGYAGLRRVGRRTPLQPEQREAVWDLYQAYDGLMRASGVHDFNDLLLMALAEVRDRPLSEPYSSVIVDEVQDLTCIGVQLLHALVGDRVDGLLIIGDGQQAVYPGGFTLAEAGIAVTGRSRTLRTNYRNSAEILSLAAAVVGDDTYDDLDGEVEPGEREVRVTRSGGRTRRVDAEDARSLDIALVEMLRRTLLMPTVNGGDIGLLCRTNGSATRYQRLLERNRIPSVSLLDYDGHVTDAVKVGTYKRAKGLEFKFVMLPGLRDGSSKRGPDEPEAAYRERIELEHRELYVAMTRARDGLWLGYIGGALRSSRQG